MDISDERFSDEAVGALIGLARSANVSFDLIDGRLTMRAVRPKWRMWQPVRFLLDEVGHDRIEAYLAKSAVMAVRRPDDDDEAMPVSRDAMVRWATTMRGRAQS